MNLAKLVLVSDCEQILLEMFKSIFVCVKHTKKTVDIDFLKFGLKIEQNFVINMSPLVMDYVTLFNH